MHDYTTLPLEELFKQAVEDLPFADKEATSITQGSLTEPYQGEIEYSEEWTFTAGTLLNERLVGGGWIELRKDENADILINGFFGIARNGDWKEGSILKEYEALQGWYNPVTRTWELQIDTY
jgi:hypothetical protein